MTVLTAAGAPLAAIDDRGTRVMGVAVHAGHELRPSLKPFVALSDSARRREEDPFTAEMLPDGITTIEVVRSRFEVDLNRPRSRCVYGGPEDAWGLDVWASPLTAEEDRVSREVYDAFYSALELVLIDAVARNGRCIVLDVHSYNHRREGADAPPADPATNPEINLGTRWLDMERWSPVSAAFTEALRCAGFDVGENVKFGGGHLAHWVSERFGADVCALAIEFKKTYMDEWTGTVDESAVHRIKVALTSAVGPLASAADDIT